MNPDPIGIGDGVNVYAYCGNDPVGNVDSSGTQTTKPIFLLSVSTAQYAPATDAKQKNINVASVLADKKIEATSTNKLLSTGTNNVNFSKPIFNKPEPKTFLESIKDIANGHNSLFLKDYKSTSIEAFKGVFTHPLPKKFLDLYTYGKGKPYIMPEKEMKQLNPTKVGIQGFTPEDNEKFRKAIPLIKRGETVNFASIVASSANVHGTLGRFWVHFQGKLTKFEDDSWSFEGTMYFKDAFDFVTTPTAEDGLTRSGWGDDQTEIARLFLIGLPVPVSSAVVNVKQTSKDANVDWFNGVSDTTVPNIITTNPELKKEAQKIIKDIKTLID